jgi:hypothetical protein
MKSMDRIIDKNKVNLDCLFKTLGKEHEEYVGAIEVDDDLVSPYIDTFEKMLKNILIRIARSKISRDSLLLTANIINLLNKLMATYAKGNIHD